jgi:hypothetical protein
MLRSLGISLALLGLLIVGVDGFRLRERTRTATPGNSTAATPADVHLAEYGVVPPN